MNKRQHWHVTITAPGAGKPYYDKTHPTGTHAKLGVNGAKMEAKLGDIIASNSCSLPNCEVEIYPPQRAAVLSLYPDAFSQKNGSHWDINLNSMEGVIEGVRDEDTAWAMAAVAVKAPGYDSPSHQDRVNRGSAGPWPKESDVQRLEALKTSRDGDQ